MSIFKPRKVEPPAPWIAFSVDMETGKIKRERNAGVNLPIQRADVLFIKDEGVWILVRARGEKEARARAQRQVKTYFSTRVKPANYEAA